MAIRRRSAVGLVAVTLVGAAAGRLLLGAADQPSAQPTSSPAKATAPVVRRDLVERESTDGTLGYAQTRSVVGRLAGTITWMPGAGALIRRGEALYRVDGRPVVLFYGSVPAYRRLAKGVSDGADVLQLERNLTALGYDPEGAMAVDERFTAATAAAVRRWQRARGLPQTGVVELGRVIFLPGARRVADAKLGVGSSVGSGGGGGGAAGGQGSQGGGEPGTEIMRTTSTRRVVTVELAVSKQTLARRGAAVGVEVPNGATVPGRIASVGTVARKKSSGGGDGAGGNGAGEGGGSSSEATITVTVAVRARRGMGRLDQAPVSVRIARQTRRGALAVPVTALLALSGGRYAVEVVTASGASQLPVVPGLFADGYVEVSGRGLRPGLRVSVPGE